MKLILLSLFAVLATCQCVSQQAGLQRDFIDFLDVFPLEKLRIILVEHAQNDEEFQNAIVYIRSDEFAQKVSDLWAKSSVQELLDLFRQAGVNVDFVGRLVLGFINSLNVVEHEEVKRSFEKFIVDISKVIDMEKLYEIFDYKLKTSEFFKYYYGIVSSAKMEQTVEKIIKLPEFHIVASDLVQMDVDVYKAIEEIYSFFGWNSPNQTGLEVDDTIQQTL